jgi:hypothetical protein
MVDGDPLRRNKPHILGKNIHDSCCRRLRYSSIGDGIRYLEYTLGDDLRLLATKNSSNLSKQKKIKIR